jgi:WD40 repeat protein
MQAYAEPIRSHALHIFHSVYATMPNCSLLIALTEASAVPELKHSLLSPRAAHWGFSGTILEAGSEVDGVVLSPDGLLIIAGTVKGDLRVWSMVDFEEVARLVGHEDSIWSVAISSDGLRIVSGSRDSTMRVWNGQTFEELGLCEHNGEVNAVAFSPDNSLAVSGSSDSNVWIWNVLTCEEVIRLAGHATKVRCVAFFPNGTKIASASDDGTVRIWDARTYESLPGIQCSESISAMAISPDSTRLALVEDRLGGEGVLRLFVVVTLAITADFAWLTLGERISDNMHMFDVFTLVEQAQVEISPGVYLPCGIDFSPDGDSIALGTGSGAVEVRKASDLSIISMIKGHQGQVMSIVLSPDSSKIVSGSMDETVRIRPVECSEEQDTRLPGHDAKVNQVVFSSDGSRLVSGSDDKTVRIWDGLTCEELAVLHGHENAVSTIAYSPDGARVVSGSDDNTVRVWDALNFREVTVLKGHRNYVAFVTFSPDGTQIASCSWDHTVRLWSSSTLQESARLEGHRDVVWSVAFSPNGTRLVSTSEDRTVRVWDAVNFTQVAELEARHVNIYWFYATFSLDGKAILTRLWDKGLSWVCSDDNDGEEFFHVRNARYG